LLGELTGKEGGLLLPQVMLDEGTGKCRGVGFVNYTSYEGARAAIAAMHGSMVGDKMLHVSLQQQRDSGRAGRPH
jgi:polyadenylate-binding protein